MTNISQKDQQTIVAISTSSAPAAIGIIRLSGSKVLEIIHQVCKLPSGKPLSFNDKKRQQIYCHLHLKDGSVLDDLLVCYFQNPSSYTGEDLAELSLHGNPLLLSQATQLLLSTGLCRPAKPGEFTRRAYLSGRLDLTQAEAVHSIITARSALELQVSRRNLSGELSRTMSNLRSQILHLKAETEAEVDFSTEDLHYETREERKRSIEKIQSLIQDLIRRGKETRRLRSGFQVALVGVPNSGKSSLLNKILGWDRAIVSAIPGTTRDYLSEEIIFEGVLVRFVDTAGLRESDNEIENQGMKMSQQTASQSQIVLHLIDGEKEPYELPVVTSEAKTLYLYNKKDSTSYTFHNSMIPANCESLEISCKTNEGMDSLREYLRDIIFQTDIIQDPLLLEDRHAFHLEKVATSLSQVMLLWEGNAPDEITALEIDDALENVGCITGRIDTEEILGRIFSIFCVGK